jgi:hypothetical protein
MILNPTILIKLSESEKRFLIVLFFVIVVLLFVFGLFYEGVSRYMAKQGEDIGRLMATQVESGYISSLKQFQRNSFRKSRLEFYRQFSKTFIMMLVWFALYGTISIFYQHWLDLFDYTSEGFTTILWKFDYANTPRAEFFGMSIISDWPPLLHTPFFSAKAIPSYILALFGIVILILFVGQVLSYMARTLFIVQHSKKMFTRDLRDYKLSDLSAAPAELQESGVNVPEVASKQPQPPTNG